MQSGLRGVILGWMDYILLAQRDSTEEEAVREIEQNTLDIYQYMIQAHLVSPSTMQSFAGKNQHVPV